MTAKQMTRLIVKFGYSTKHTGGLALTLDGIRAAQRNCDELPFNLGWVGIEGLAWAVSTGRLMAEAEMTIRRMTPREVIALVAEITVSNERPMDVPRWLNAQTWQDAA